MIATETIAEQLQTYIAQGNELLSFEKYNDNKLKLWGLRVSRTLTGAYDDEVADMFMRNLNHGGVFRMGMTRQEMFVEHDMPKVRGALDFLEELLEQELPAAATKPTATHENLRSIKVENGTVIFGNDNTVSNVTVGDFLVSLEREIERSVTDNEAKSKAKSAIATLTSNETFATVVGQTLGAFLGHAIK